MRLRWTFYGFIFLFLSVTAVVGCASEDEPTPAASLGVPSAEPTAIESTASVPASDANALEAMAYIEEQVSELRELETLEPVSKAFLSTDELRERMTEDLEEDYSPEEARDEALLYAAFELMDADLDLYNLMIDLYSEQVAGFYDPETKEMYVVKGEGAPGALERFTYSHEYTHVLQDQHYDLEEKEDEADEDSEQQIAFLSLVEGDATLLMQQYAIQHFSADDIQEVLSESATFETGVLDSAPEIVQQSLLFPYEKGLAFAMTLFAKGGWEAVDAAYANPPLSTEQIIHPDHYPYDVPDIVSLPALTDTLGAGWRLVDEDVMGEFALELYLKNHVDSDAAKTAAEGWGGDRYAVHWRDDESGFVLALRSAWDSASDAAEFFDTYTQFAEGRFGNGPTRREADARLVWLGDDALLLARNAQDETLVLIAPDEDTLNAVLTLFPDF